MQQAIHGVLVTFQRPDDLSNTLEVLTDQTRRLDTLIVVDNGADARTESILAAHPNVAARVDYLAAPENLGPAGGLAMGAMHVLESVSTGAEDWVMFLDDDDPPRTDTTIADVAGFASRMREAEPHLGGVGLVGGRINRRHGRGERIPDDQLTGPIDVDYIGGNQFPCLRLAAVREVGVPRPELFFGFDDLEYGLRFKTAGRPLFVDGDLWLLERQARGRLNVDHRPKRAIAQPGWRDYYNTRNLVWLYRAQHLRGAAARVVATRVLAKPVANLLRDPRAAFGHLGLGARGAFDGYRGRLGRRIEPAKAGKAT